MKNVITSALVAAPLLFAATQSFALVRLVANCDTSDGQYNVTIADNQGIGMVRTSNYGATVKDANDNVVASYKLTLRKSSGSISFGHESLVDTATNGKDFVFDYPSTNTPYALKALLLDGTTVNYGQRFNPSINEGNLVCKTFGR